MFQTSAAGKMNSMDSDFYMFFCTRMHNGSQSQSLFQECRLLNWSDFSSCPVDAEMHNSQSTVLIAPLSLCYL